MRCCAPESTLLRSIGPRWVSAVFEVVADLVEAFFTDDVLSVRTEAAAVDNSFDEFIGGGAKIPARGDPADAFEAESIPYPAGCDVGFIDEIKD